eukprot:3369388-Rhodomonas_salina.1
MSSCHAVSGLWWAGLHGRERNQKRGKRGEGGDLGLGGSLHAAPPPLHDSALCKQGVSSLLLGEKVAGNGWAADGGSAPSLSHKSRGRGV